MQHLTECFLPSVWRFVYARVGRDPHLAEDIVSETVLALIRAASDPEADISNPGGWLRSVASNKVNDHFRAAARVQHLIDQARQTTELADFDEPSRNQEQEERRAEIRSVMDGLPDQYRLILEWKYIDRLSVRSIADRMDVSEKAAESVLFRARRDFRDRVLRVDQEDSRLSKNGAGGQEKDQEKVSDDQTGQQSEKAAKAAAQGSCEW
ncbi:MAG: sigma-70 family RNA polymerase sigma factor [Rhodopirellula sp.]|nr:sigma-70 family RNA polymerase sigma factor [Rhodopirellula sp.]